MKTNGKEKERMGKRFKSTAVPSIFFNKKPSNPPRKTLKKRLLNSTPSPLKRSKFVVFEHNYFSIKQLKFDDPDSFFENDVVIETDNNFSNETTNNNDSKKNLINPKLKMEQ